MGKRQTRRSISIRGITYQWVMDYCKDNGGQTISGYIERLIEKDLELKQPKPEKITSFAKPKPRKNEEPDAAGGIFSF